VLPSVLTISPNVTINIKSLDYNHAVRIEVYLKGEIVMIIISSA